MTGNTISVLIADNEELILSALSTLLDLEEDIDVITQCTSGHDAIKHWQLLLASQHPPNVAILDLQMPGLDRIDTAAKIRSLTPNAAILIVTSYGRPGYLKRALTAGVRGFLPKTTSVSVLANAVRILHQGGRYVDPELAAETIAMGDSPLTPRETDVLMAAADGANIEEVARRVFLSQGTTRNYLSSAAAKLGASNRHEACILAREQGWI